MKHLCIVVFLLLVFRVTQAQIIRPAYVPFQVKNKYGIMDTLGNETVTAGTVGQIIPLNQFKIYYIKARSSKEKDWIMSAATGKKITEYGDPKTDFPVFIGNSVYRHFNKDGKSLLVSFYSKTTITLPYKYESIGHAIPIFDTTNKISQFVIPAQKNWRFTDLLFLDSNLKITSRALINITGYQLAIKTIESRYSDSEYLPVGIVVERDSSSFIIKHPQPKSVKGKITPFTPPDFGRDAFYIYDNTGKLLGEVANNDSAVSATLGCKVELMGNIPVSPAIGSGSWGNEKSQTLNNEFIIARDIMNKTSSLLWLYQKKADATMNYLLSNKEVRFNFYNIDEEKKILNLHKETNKRETVTECYFDYDGIIFPKNKLMIPAKYYPFDDNAMRSFLYKVHN